MIALKKSTKIFRPFFLDLGLLGKILLTLVSEDKDNMERKREKSEDKACVTSEKSETDGRVPANKQQWGKANKPAGCGARAGQRDLDSSEE